MADINEARQQMMEELQRKIQTDSKLSSIRNKIQNGDYSEASQYGVRSGEILSEVIRGNITEELFQQCDVKGLGDMLLPVIKQENQYVANAVSAAQKAQNAEVGIGIKPLQAENDLSAYFNIFGKMKSDAYDSFEQASWLLDEPIVHDSLSIVDDTLQENAEFQYKSGLRTCVIRDPEPDCCDWCAERAGTFYYPDVPDYVWERHNHCLCEIRIETEKDEPDNNRTGSDNKILRIPEYPASSVLKKVESGRYSLNLTWNSYNKHVEGNPDYERYLKSRADKGLGPQGKITLPKDEVQEIINKYSGTGIIMLNVNGEPLDYELITCDRVIGKYCDKGVWYPTNKCRLVHGKSGSHIIPIKGNDYD